MTSCVVYHVMQVLGCKIISHMWPNVRSTCLCVYVKPMPYFKFTHIHMFAIDLQVHIYVSWFSLCYKFTYMYVDLVCVARFTSMIFMLTILQVHTYDIHIDYADDAKITPMSCLC